jgi:hypothetical protein
MNYAIGVFGVMLVIAVSFWFIQGSRTCMEVLTNFIHRNLSSVFLLWLRNWIIRQCMGLKNMNYAIGVFGVMLVIAVSFWFIQGSRTYLNTEEIY